MTSPGKDSCSTTATYTVTRTGRSSSSQNLTVFWRTRSFDDLPLAYTASDLDINKVTSGSISFIGDDQTGATGNSLTFTVDVYNDDHFEYPDEMFGVELYVQYIQYTSCTTWKARRLMLFLLFCCFVVLLFCCFVVSLSCYMQVRYCLRHHRIKQSLHDTVIGRSGWLGQRTRWHNTGILLAHWSNRHFQCYGTSHIFPCVIDEVSNYFVRVRVLLLLFCFNRSSMTETQVSLK